MIPLTKGGSIEVVSLLDNAIDWEKSDRANFLATHKTEYLKFKKDCVPTRFVVKGLSVGRRAEIFDSSSYIEGGKQKWDQHAGSLAIFKACVLDIKDGPQIKRNDKGELADEVLDAVGWDVVQEMAAVALRYSSLTEDERKNLPSPS